MGRAIRRTLVAGTALAALALSGAAPALASSKADAVSAAAAPGAVAHAASGCAGMTVVTPKAGAAVGAAAMGMPAGTEGFYAKAAASHATWLTDLSCTTSARTHSLKPAPAAASGGKRIGNTGYLSTNWSGYQINRTAQYVQSGWTVPTVTKPIPAYSTAGYYSSTWTGIGGGFNAGSGPLIQSGTEQEVAASGATTYYFWYEVVGGSGDTRGEVRISMPVHPGDVVGAVSLWTAATGAEMGVCNFSTTNTCVQFYVPSSAPGTSEEWIEEAPYNGGVLPLANFGTVNFFNGCWAPLWQTGATCQTITSGAPSAISLERYVFGAYQVLAYPGPFDAAGEGFPITYQPPERCPNC